MSEVTSAARVSRGFRTAAETIVCGDGTELAAIVVQPDGPGRFPLLVMPSSWAVNDVEYVAAAVRLARLDYVVVSYTSRGFWNSGGEIDIAGSATVGDVSTVIAWAIDRYPVSDMIGAVGISYGAGTSLLAAAVDDRIKAVAAMSTWASLAAALVPNGALSTQAAHLLVWAGDVTGRPGPDMLAMREYLTAGQIGPDSRHAARAVAGRLGGCDQREQTCGVAGKRLGGRLLSARPGRRLLQRADLPEAAGPRCGRSCHRRVARSARPGQLPVGRGPAVDGPPPPRGRRCAARRVAEVRGRRRMAFLPGLAHSDGLDDQVLSGRAEG